MTWLPRIWPANARLIATSIPSVETDSLARRAGFRLLDLVPLTAHESGRIVDAVYRRYRRRPNSSVKEALLNKRSEGGGFASGTPLWLEFS
jgi:hypothetical protein